MARWCLPMMAFAALVSAEEVVRNATQPSSHGWAVELLRAGRMLFAGCERRLSISSANDELEGCVGMRVLRAMDRLLARDVLHLPYGVELIRDHKIQTPQDADGVGGMRPGDAPSSVDVLNETLSRAARLLRTHSLRIPLPVMPANGSFDVFEGRRRRHKNDMMGLFLFGIMAMTVIAIPLGFQFLAVLGGKALLLAKLALILTSIQGLKKIATSNLSYGLYHAPAPPLPPRPWLYDRRWPPAHGEPEHTGLFGGFDLSQDPHSLDGIKSKIILPRLGFMDSGIERQREPAQ